MKAGKSEMNTPADLIMAADSLVDHISPPFESEDVDLEFLAVVDVGEDVGGV